MRHQSVLSCFFFNDTATTEIYTLSLHDALPIWSRPVSIRGPQIHGVPVRRNRSPSAIRRAAASTSPRVRSAVRSEEHTSELQSRQYLVCRLLLEKKKNTNKPDPNTIHPMHISAS